jgi:hypothetical protein
MRGFTMQKKIVSTISTLAVASAGVLYAAPSDAGQAHKPHREATNFAFKGSGYGTKATGGQVPVGSDTSAFQAFGCSNMAGSRHENFVAVEQLPGAGQAEEITTKLATSSAAGETASTSRSHVARVVFGQAGGGSVEITSITSVAKALYDNQGFDSQITSTIGGITVTPPAGDPQTIPVPSPGQSVPLPGVGTLTLGTGTHSANGRSASAVADGIRVDLTASDTSVRIAHTAAKLERGVVSGLMAGNSLSARSSFVGGVAQLGKTPLSVMPCRGTDGLERVKSIASVTPSPGVELRNLTSRQLGTQGSATSSGTEFGRVGVAEFNDADILVKNVIGQVNVVTSADKTSRSTDGTEVGKVMVQGEEREFPDSDVINIPGVARLQRSIVERTPNGISVIALRVTLFDGQGQVESILNLGEAALAIKNAP